MCNVGDLPVSKNYNQSSSSLQPPDGEEITHASSPPPPPSSNSGAFPATANGTNGFTPITSTRSHTLFEDNSNNPSGAAGKSCFVLPSLGKKKKRALRVSSSAASTADQSSTADPFQLYDNDQQGLLEKHRHHNKQGGGKVDWYMEPMVEEPDEDVSSNGMGLQRQQEQKEQQRQQQQYNPQREYYSTPSERSSSSSHRNRQNNMNMKSVTPPSSASSTEPAPSLLQLPTPQDRSHDARRKQTKTSGQMYKYQGELEPEGVRGQEATVATTPTTGTTSDLSSVPLRNFDDSPQSIGHRVSQRKQQLKLQMEQDYDDAEEEEEEEGSQGEYETEKRTLTKSASQVATPQRPPRSNHPARSPAAFSNGPTIFSSTSTERHYNGRISSNPRQSQESNNSDYKEIVNNNLAEIVQQQEVNKDGQNQDRNHQRTRQIPQGQHLQGPPPSGTRGTMAAIHREEDHGHVLDSQSPRGDHAYGMSSEHASPAGIGESSTTTSSSSPKGLRQSAPVNVDDTSFEDPTEHIQGIHAMAMEHTMRGEYDIALQAFTEVLRVYLTQYGRAHPLTASAYHNLGTVHTKRAGLLLDHTLHQRHCREQALLCFQAAARSARDCPELGPNHPNVAVSLVRIGFLLLQSRQYQNAVITFEEALRIRVDHFGPTHGLVANLYNNLGVCHMHLQNFPVGRKYLQQALDIQKELLNQEEYSTTALLELADTCCNIGGLNLEWIRQQVSTNIWFVNSSVALSPLHVVV